MKLYGTAEYPALRAILSLNGVIRRAVQSMKSTIAE